MELSTLFFISAGVVAVGMLISLSKLHGVGERWLLKGQEAVAQDVED